MDEMNSTVLEMFRRSGGLFSPDAKPGQFLRWIDSLCKDHLENPNRELYEEILAEEATFSGARPFLSIVIRTQGRRIVGLKEDFLCLFSQSDQDFEVILVGHRVDRDGDETIRRIIAEQPQDLREKIRYYQLDIGNRAAPLNFGFSHARGKYIVSYDDDDLVNGDWIKALHDAAAEQESRLLHVFAVAQEWSNNAIPGSDVPAPRADGAPNGSFCLPFDLGKQLHHNLSPFFSIAFPAYLFQSLKIWFDESLDVAEDWDYIMRCALLVGVTDIHRTLLVYRLWNNASSSHTAHSDTFWDETYERICRKQESYMILLEPGASRTINSFYADPLLYAQTFLDNESARNNPPLVVGPMGDLFKLKMFIKSKLRPTSFLYRLGKLVYKSFTPKNNLFRIGKKIYVGLRKISKALCKKDTAE